MREAQTIRVNEFPPTLNELNRMHFRTRARLKVDWEQLVKHECMVQGIEPVGRISMTLEFFFPDKRRRDADNYGFAAKFIADGLVKSGILKDDTFDEIAEIRVVRGGFAKPKHILIHLQEVSA